jgi:hypothetical protein
MLTTINNAVRFLLRSLRRHCEEAEIQKVIIDFIDAYVDEGLSRAEGNAILTNIGIQTCLGCRENQPNQLAHVDYGGCLYVENEFYGDSK